MNADVTTLIIAILTLAFGVISGYMLRLRANVKPDWQATLDKIIPILVQAAEQVYGAGNGSQKLEYVLNNASLYFENSGIQIDAAIIRAWIESTVHDMTRKKAND